MSTLARFKGFRRSFRSRIFIAFTVLTALIAASFIAIAINNEIKNYKERSDEKARLLASMLADTVRLPLFAGDRSALEQLAGEMLSTSHVARITITDHENQALVDLHASPASFKDQPTASASVRVLAPPSTPTVGAALSGVPSDMPHPYGTVSVSIDTSDLKQSINTTILKTGAVVLLFWITVLAVTYPVLKRITRSFDTLIQGLDTMMEGDFSQQIAVETDDEAGRATQAVNRLAATLEERDAENRSLQADLLNAMKLEMQEEKRKMMAKMIQTNRMTSLGLLISSMAHNINTPNGAIKLAGQYIQRAWKDFMPILEGLAKEEGDFQVGGLQFSEARGEFASAAEAICRNAERVERVIQDLRAYNVGERSEFAPGVSVNQAVEGALTIIRAHGRQAQVAITHQLASDLPTITGNKHQIEQVVVNLLLNAMQATPHDRGTVTIASHFESTSSEVQIMVTDEGEGLPDSVIQKLFEPFTSTRIDKGGSGLGLYISNFIVTEHKGRISFSSNHPKGTIATVHLPVL